MPELRPLAALLRARRAGPPRRGPARPCPSGRAAAAPGTRSRPSWRRTSRARPSTRPGSAAPCSRAAMFTASPVSIRSRVPLHALLVDEHLAGLDADPHRELRLALGREPAVQLGQHRLHLERRAHRPFGVVLVGAGDAEDRQHRIAHELLGQALVAGDLLGEAVESPSRPGSGRSRDPPSRRARWSPPGRRTGRWRTCAPGGAAPARRSARRSSSRTGRGRRSPHCTVGRSAPAEE